MAVARRTSDDVVDEVLRRTDIVGVISEHVHLKKAGREWIGLCPFHEERTPSFTVSPAKQMFYCFGCQTGGSALTFLMKKEGLAFTEALEVLAKQAGVALPDRSGPEAAQRDEQRRVLYEALETAARYFSSRLNSDAGSGARGYLERRVIDPETAAAFRLGYATPGWRDLQGALDSRFPASVLERAGLIIARPKGSGHYDRFRNRLMFPIIDHAGRVVGFGGRALDPATEPKYLNSPETPVFNKRRVWYGFDRARSEIARTGHAIVVEGYMDLISVHRAGFRTAVASLGTSLSSEQAMTLSRLAPRVTIAFDADSAGESATLRGLGMFRQFGARVMVCELPAGEDPDSVIANNGPEAFAKSVDAAAPLFDYRMARCLPGGSPANVEEKMAAVQKVLPVLADIDDEVERDHHAGEAAMRLGVDKNALLAEMRRRSAAARHRTANSRHNRGDEQDRGNGVSEGVGVSGAEIASTLDPGTVVDRRAELELIEIMLADPGAAADCAPRLDAAHFRDPMLHSIVAAIKEAVDDGGGPLANRVLARLDDEKAVALVSRLALSAAPDNAGEVLSGLMDQVHSRRTRDRIAELRREIATSEHRGEAVDAGLVMELDRLLRQAKRTAR